MDDVAISFFFYHINLYIYIIIMVFFIKDDKISI